LKLWTDIWPVKRAQSEAVGKQGLFGVLFVKDDFTKFEIISMGVNSMFGILNAAIVAAN